MKQGFGVPVFPGVAMGPAVVCRKAAEALPQASGDAAAERAKWEAARKAARRQLRALAELGEDQAAILEVQLLLLDDPDYVEAVTEALGESGSAAVAVRKGGDALAAQFAAMEDPYLRARSADIRDLTGRLFDILCGNAQFAPPPGAFLLVAEELSPSEMIRLPKDRLLGFVTRRGSALDHTAILAKTWNIPSLVGADLPLETAENCRLLAVDGFDGCWYADPDEETLAALRAKQRTARDGLEAYRGRETVTPSGKKVHLLANIGCPEDAAAALRQGAEGVGLLRSECLYLGREALPTEEELFHAYQKVGKIMGQRPVIIRTLDLGADKQPDYLGLPREENPALGLRGLRLCLSRQDVFRTQLRAICRASAAGNLLAMFPMVASLWELQAAKALCAQVMEELTAEGHPLGALPVGVMIETPAAAILARELAKEVDFFSVGTNDLTQYTLAVDRQNPNLAPFCDPHHPAVLALLEYVANAAREAGIWAGVCGELAADPAMQLRLAEMGYRELSMAAGSILESRRRICNGGEKP